MNVGILGINQTYPETQGILYTYYNAAMTLIQPKQLWRLRFSSKTAVSSRRTSSSGSGRCPGPGCGGVIVVGGEVVVPVVAAAVVVLCRRAHMQSARGAGLVRYPTALHVLCWFHMWCYVETGTQCTWTPQVTTVVCNELPTRTAYGRSTRQACHGLGRTPGGRCD